ncbi:hypothetical protein HDV57DRAFT_495152 [Trichoderma longibrachiatum]
MCVWGYQGGVLGVVMVMVCSAPMASLLYIRKKGWISAFDEELRGQKQMDKRKRKERKHDISRVTSPSSPSSVPHRPRTPSPLLVPPH